MCGISGCICDDDTAVKCVIKSINRLQNRGYDSAGVATKSVDTESILIKKYVSMGNQTAIQCLNTDSDLVNTKASVAIAHTRWATHGAVVTQNAHPHHSMGGEIALIHNGIVENYLEIKKILIANSYNFYGSTDSEIVANYIDYVLKARDNVCDAEVLIILNATLTGSWAILFMSTNHPNKIFYLKNGSPMLIGFNATHTKTMIVSELTGFDSDITTYNVIANMDCGYITAKEIVSNNVYELFDVSDSARSVVEYPHPFPYWTLREIYDQPAAITNCLENRLVSNRIVLSEIESNCANFNLFRTSESVVADKPAPSTWLTAEHLIFLGCGTSYHAAKIGAHYFMELGLGKTIDVIDGADFEPEMIPVGRQTLLIILSQSGETKDLIRGLDIGKKFGIKSVGLINVADSQLSRMVDVCLYLRAGRENAVASTKCFTNQVVLLLCVALWMGQQLAMADKWALIESYIGSLQTLSADCDRIIEQSIKEIKSFLPVFDNQSSCFILGKHQSELVAKEGALKIKEISYIHAEGYGAASLKHGPFALLSVGTPVILIIPNDKFYAKNHNVTQEVKSRMAHMIHITNVGSDTGADDVFYFESDSKLFHLLAVVPLQILAYEISIAKKLNPDFPRNLAKVVTVE